MSSGSSATLGTPRTERRREGVRDRGRDYVERAREGGIERDPEGGREKGRWRKKGQSLHGELGTLSLHIYCRSQRAKEWTHGSAFQIHSTENTFYREHILSEHRALRSRVSHSEFISVETAECVNVNTYTSDTAFL
jgi:hypothetical protein